MESKDRNIETYRATSAKLSQPSYYDRADDLFELFGEDGKSIGTFKPIDFDRDGEEFWACTPFGDLIVLSASSEAAKNMSLVCSI